MRFKWLFVGGLFGVGLLLLPFSYASYSYISDEAPAASLNIAEAQGHEPTDWSVSSLWQAIVKQINGVLDFTAQTIQAVGDVPGQLFDVASNDPPETSADLQNFDPLINSDVLLPGLPAPQAYNGTLVINVPLQATSELSVSGITRLNDLLVLGEFSINDLTVPGVVTAGSLVAGGTQLGSLSVSGNTQLNTLSVAGPVSFSNLTVTNSLTALGGLNTQGADIDLQGGNIFAANIVNEIIAGDNISIDGTQGAPIISADIPSFGSRVRRLNGLTGTLTLVAGSDIVISESGSEITVDNISDLDSVTARGGCSSCVLDADVIDSLTIASGTIDNTVIGSTTPAQGTFSSLRVASAQSQLFFDSDNSNYVGFRGSSTIASNIVWTLPTADGNADQFLFTDGNGNLRFDDVSVLGVVNDLPDLGDVTLSSPANGDVLSYNGAEWVNAPTSSFGLGDGTYLGLSDTPSSYVSNAVAVVNSVGSALTQSANFTFDGTQGVGIGTASTSALNLFEQSEVRFYEPGSGNYVGFQASTSLSGNTIWTLPEADGNSDQVMVTDGSGNLRFADVSAIGGGVSNYLELDDTPNSFLVNAIPYVSTSSIKFSSDLTYNGSTGFFGIGTDAPTDELTVLGSVYIGLDPSTPGISYNDLDNTVSIGSTIHEERFTVSQGSILQRGGSSTELYSPTQVGSLNLTDNAYAVTILGDRAYVASRLTGADFHVIDIADKGAPSLIGSLDLPDSARQVSVRGNYAYVVTDFTGSDFHVIDISDPTSPSEVASLGLGTSATGLAIRGRYAYVGTGDAIGADFYVIDIIDPLDPTIVGSIDIGADINSIALKGSYAYVVTDGPSNIISISISDPTSPAVVDTTAMTAEGSDIVVRGDYAYVTANSGGNDFFVFDIADPSNLTNIASMNLASAANGVDVSGRYAYVTTNGTNEDLHVIDISSPSVPVEVGSVEMNTGSAFGIQVRGRYAYIGSAATGNDFHIYDVTGVEAQSVLAHSLESGDLTVAGDMVASGDFSLDGALEVGVGGIRTEGILLVKGSETSVISGSLAIGTSSSDYALTVDGDVHISGQLYDSTLSAGNVGDVLIASVGGQAWTPTTSLGLSAEFTSSADLAGILSNETGSGSAVFSDSPTLTGTAVFANATFDQVGIGTTTPSQTLHIYDASSATLLIEGNTGDALLDLNASSGVGDYGAITFYKDGTFTNQIYTGSGSDDNLYVDTSSSNTYTIFEGAGVGIGTTTPSSTLTVEGTIMASNLYGGTTGLQTDAQGNIIRVPSDIRLKKNVESIGSEEALEIVLALRGVRYEWIDATRFGTQTEIGFIAQEVDLVLPEVVRKGGNYWSLNTPNMLAVVVAAIQDLWSMVTGNQEKIDTLEGRVEYLESLLEVEVSDEENSKKSGSSDHTNSDPGEEEIEESESENDTGAGESAIDVGEELDDTSAQPEIEIDDPTVEPDEETSELDDVDELSSETRVNEENTEETGEPEPEPSEKVETEKVDEISVTEEAEDISVTENTVLEP